MQWKIHFYLNTSDLQQELRPDEKRMKSQKTSFSNNKLDTFEDDHFRQIRKINFRNTRSEFQAQMKGDIKRMRKSGKICVRADKSRSITK